MSIMLPATVSSVALNFAASQVLNELRQPFRCNDLMYVKMCSAHCPPSVTRGLSRQQRIPICEALRFRTAFKRGL